MDKHLSNDEKRALQLDELPILDELDRLAKKHGLQYFITAGTLLGAVRHGGFIPWDDDIDVVMTTKDYKKLAKLAKTELSEGFFFQDERSEKGYPFFFGKIRKDGAEVREEILDVFDIHKGRYIDIFPLSKCPKNPFLANLMFKLVRFYNVAIVSKNNPAFTLGYTKKAARLAFRLVSRLPSGFIKWLRRFTVGFFGIFCSGKRLATVAGNHGYPRETYDAKWFEESVMLTFEGKEYPAPKQWHSLLSSMYGDYMTPPDENDRDGHFIKDDNNTNNTYHQGE